MHYLMTSDTIFRSRCDFFPFSRWRSWGCKVPPGERHGVRLLHCNFLYLEYLFCLSHWSLYETNRLEHNYIWMAMQEGRWSWPTVGAYSILVPFLSNSFFLGGGNKHILKCQEKRHVWEILPSSQLLSIGIWLPLSWSSVFLWALWRTRDRL